MEGGLNTYGYVGGSPLLGADPDGLLFGGLRNAGECYGESATQYWADKQVETGNPMYAVPGLLSALWTRDTSDYTVIVLSAGRYRPSLSSWSQWIKNPLKYERGSKTVSTEIWNELGLEELSVLERADKLGKLSYVPISKGPWVQTLKEGPTPGGWLGAIGGAVGLSYWVKSLGANIDCSCN